MILLDRTGCESLKSLSAKSLSPEISELLECVSHKHHHNQRLKAYSCFDGDDLSDIELMRIMTHELHFTPINPEYVLGYYISVKALGTKQEVMRCCLSIAEHCDELWVFSRGKQVDRTFTEGMLAEIMMFRRQNSICPIRIFDLQELKQKDYRYLNTSRLQSIEVFLDTHIDDIIEHYPFDQRQEIVSGLLDSYCKGDKYPLVYVVVAPKDIKYLDWARTFTLEKKQIPVNSHAVLGSFLLRLAHNNSKAEMLRDVLNVMDITSEMWIFGEDDILSLYHGNCSSDIAVELQLWLRHFRHRPIRLIRWSETRVPKYLAPSWALTSKERLETQVSTNTRRG